MAPAWPAWIVRYRQGPGQPESQSRAHAGTTRAIVLFLPYLGLAGHKCRRPGVNTMQTRTRCGSARRTAGKAAVARSPASVRRRGPRGHQRAGRAGPHHAGSGRPPRRSSRRALPPRAQQETTLRPHPRRGARRGRPRSRPRNALDRAGGHARAPPADGPGEPSGYRRAAQDARPRQSHIAGAGRGIPRATARAFLRALPASRFPILAAHGIHAWADDREERFTSGLGTLLRGLQAAEVPRRPPSPVVPAGDRVSSLGF
jgi:hypothetical protein